MKSVDTGKAIITLLFCVGFCYLISTCDNTSSVGVVQPSGQVTPAKNVEASTTSSNSAKLLTSAKKIVISEHTISMGKDYDILVDGKKVATVTGKNVRVFGGDVFTLTTADGSTLAYEKENKRFLSFDRAATIYDAGGNVTGYLAEKKFKSMFSLSYIFYFYDQNKKEIGKSAKLSNSSLGKQFYSWRR
jgi:hypothetical protein